jgi:tetratricopeptide (TPR) repeat protein
MSSSKKLFFGFAGIIFLTFISYVPAMSAGFIWDDDYHVTENQTLKTVDGLRKIWLEPGAVPQYYPLVHTSFWIEYRLWHLNPAGYHLINILLHALNAVLLLIIFQRFRIPGCFLIAAVFALHPVNVESVAWITERKNTLSGFFCLCSLLAALRFFIPYSEIPNPSAENAALSSSRKFYFLSLALFLFALLSKTVTCTMPLILILLIWWKNGKVRIKDILLMFPFFIFSLFFSLFTIWIERNFVGAQGYDWTFSFLERCIIAGKAFWFYLYKLILPLNLCFTYPKWSIDSADFVQYLFPVSAIILLSVLFLLRKKSGKTLFVSLSCFMITIFPALGFIDYYPMKFSFAADHFQYLAGIAPAAFIIGTAGHFRPRIRIHKYAGFITGTALVILFGFLTFSQSRIYKDQETLWQDTLSKNPDAWMAHINLGSILLDKGDAVHALSHFNEALRIKPDEPDAYLNLGILYGSEKKYDNAIDYFRKSIRIKPLNARAIYNIGVVYARQEKYREAIHYFEKAIQLKSSFSDAHFSLGLAYHMIGLLEPALKEYYVLSSINPEMAGKLLSKFK